MEEISLLFAVEAEQYLLAGMIEEAIELCVKGIQAYPGYAAGYSILAMAYRQKGENEKAREAVNSASENQPFQRHFTSLKVKLDEEPKPQETDFSELIDEKDNQFELITEKKQVLTDIDSRNLELGEENITEDTDFSESINENDNQFELISEKQQVHKNFDFLNVELNEEKITEGNGFFQIQLMRKIIILN